MRFATRRRLHGSCGGLLLGLGAVAQVDPDVDGGAALVLLGLAVLERGSGWARRLFRRCG